MKEETVLEKVIAAKRRGKGIVRVEGFTPSLSADAGAFFGGSWGALASSS
jgi:hypothetical protein